MFNIKVRETYEEVSKDAAEIMLDVVKGTEKPILGLATGSSPVGLYQEMIRDHKENGTSYKDIITFNLDEYYPIAPSNNQSYRYFMDTNLFCKINIRKECTFVPNGCAEDMEKECTINGIKEESISKSADVILASAGLDRDKDVFLSVMYYDQRQDECVGLYDFSRENELKSRQFEWSECGYYNNDIEKDLVSYELGEDHFPVFSAG